MQIKSKNISLTSLTVKTCVTLSCWVMHGPLCGLRASGLVPLNQRHTHTHTTIQLLNRQWSGASVCQCARVCVKVTEECEWAQRQCWVGRVVMETCIEPLLRPEPQLGPGPQVDLHMYWMSVCVFCLPPLYKCVYVYIYVFSLYRNIVDYVSRNFEYSEYFSKVLRWLDQKKKSFVNR